MRGLASFASSDTGKTFARVEQYWGRDPAAALEPLDDVLAHNLRAALMLTMARDVPGEPEDPVERTKRAGARIRERMNA